MKFFDIETTDQIGDDNDEGYALQILDLPNIYEDIKQYYVQKNACGVINSLEKLKTYLSQYPIEFPEQFQDILFPVLIEICQNKENEDLALYGFQFISYIMKNDDYINYMPLLTQPNFFDFCFPFLSNSSQLIIYWALDNIENFIHLHIDARNYALSQLTVTIIESFINNTNFFNEEANEFDLQVKSLLILRRYTSYQIDEENGDQIFNICDKILGDDPQYQVLYENALWTAYNLIQQYRKYVTREFIEKIDKFYFSCSTEHIIPALKILHFLISRNFTPPNSICKNFISLFFSNDKKVAKLSLDCLYQILQNQEKGAIESLINNGFLKDLGYLLSSQHFETKVRAAKMICILIEKGGNKLCYLLCHKGFMHGIFILFELEIDELTIRTLRSLIEICKMMHTPFVPEQEEIMILDELVQSESEEISNLALFFVENFLTKQKNPEYYNIQSNTNKRKGPNMRIKKEEPMPTRSKMKLWVKPTRPMILEQEFPQDDLSELSCIYNQQKYIDNEEEEEYYDHDVYKIYDY